MDQPECVTATIQKVPEDSTDRSDGTTFLRITPVQNL